VFRTFEEIYSKGYELTKAKLNVDETVTDSTNPVIQQITLKLAPLLNSLRSLT